MKIFLDTADVDLIEQYYGTGLIDGVTTNPTLIKKSGYDPEEVYRKIALIGVDDISMEIVTAKAGAAYVSPFVGRVDDNSFDGLGLIKEIADIYEKQSRLYNFVDTEILSASIRNVGSVSKSFEYGAGIVTMPPSVFEKMYNHILTDKGLDLFQKDWDAVNVLKI
jgi:transaldolase